MSEITQAQADSLTSAIRAGSDLEVSCHYSGISVPLAYRWLERGKLESERIANGFEPDPAEADYLRFWDELKKARADAVVRNVAFIQKAAQDGNWQAAAWWLERTVPEAYGKRSPKSSPAVETKTSPQLEADR